MQFIIINYNLPFRQFIIKINQIETIDFNIIFLERYFTQFFKDDNIKYLEKI
jgi:hypothetical protein